MKEFIINKNDSGQRADKFVEKTVPLLPKGMMYRYFRTKRIKLNGKRCEISARLAESDRLELYINDEFFEKKAGVYGFLSAPARISTVYEDDNILLLDKEAGLCVHSDESGCEDTLINRVQHFLYERGEYLPDSENSFAPALCNRLDRNTGGIVIAAKNAKALRIMNEKIRNRELEKKYLCVCIGRPPKNEDTLISYIFKDSSTNTVTVSDKKTSSNRTAVTEYKLLGTNGSISLLEVKLLTGRTHQIRAQMAHIGCPLLGDGKYGSEKQNRFYGIKTQALYSYKLKFDFKTNGGALEYLNGREFTVDKVSFRGGFTLNRRNDGIYVMTREHGGKSEEIVFSRP